MPRCTKNGSTNEAFEALGLALLNEQMNSIRYKILQRNVFAGANMITFGDGITEKVSMMRSGYSSRILEISTSTSAKGVGDLKTLEVRLPYERRPKRRRSTPPPQRIRTECPRKRKSPTKRRTKFEQKTSRRRLRLARTPT